MENANGLTPEEFQELKDLDTELAASAAPCKEQVDRYHELVEKILTRQTD